MILESVIVLQTHRVMINMHLELYTQISASLTQAKAIKTFLRKKKKKDPNTNKQQNIKQDLGCQGGM